MHFSTYTIAVLSGCLTLTCAAPTISGINKTQGFTAPQIGTELPSEKPIIPVAISKVYSKYGASAALPVNIKAVASQALQAGTVVAIPQDSYDSSYLVPVNIGTPPQAFMLNIDTGSSDLWVSSTLQDASQLAGHTGGIYNPLKSTTSSLLSGLSWSIGYGDGSGATGVVYSDVVTVGGTTFASQAVEAATTMSSSFVNDLAEGGLMGLAFSNINQAGQKTFFDNIKSSLPLPLFTANLRAGQAGNYNFGYIDAAEYIGAITYVPVLSNTGFWNFTADGYAVGSGAAISRPFWAIADTGTSVMLLPSDVVNAYWTANGGFWWPAAAAWLFLCDPATLNLSPFTVTIGGYRAVVPGAYMNYGVWGTYGSTPVCYGSLQNTTLKFAILGDSFLKSQFVVFNGASSPSIGFAAKNYSFVDSGMVPSSVLNSATSIKSSTIFSTNTASQLVALGAVTASPTVSSSLSSSVPAFTTSSTSKASSTQPISSSTPSTTTTSKASTSTSTSSSTSAQLATSTSPVTSSSSSKTSSTLFTTTSSSSTKAVLTSTTSTSASPISTTPTTIGCFADFVVFPNRVLAAASATSTAMTNNVCLAYCTARNMAYAGTEYSKECYCSNTAPTVKSTGCTSICSGSTKGEICGGGNALTVTYSPAIAAANAVANAYTATGCYADFVTFFTRTLSGASTSSNSMTNAQCQTFCAARSFAYAGTEYSSECYCSNTAPTVLSSGCTMSCSGSVKGEICGGSNALSVYYSGGIVQANAAKLKTAVVTATTTAGFVGRPS